jgi:hypothetical protein
MRPLPLIVSPDALRTKLPPQWLIFLFIFTEFFVTYPELGSVTLNFPQWVNRTNRQVGPSITRIPPWSYEIQQRIHLIHTQKDS